MSHWPARSHGTSIGAACWVNDTSTWRPRGDAHRHLIQKSASDTLPCFSDLNSVGSGGLLTGFILSLWIPRSPRFLCNQTNPTCSAVIQPAFSAGATQVEPIKSTQAPAEVHAGKRLMHLNYKKDFDSVR